MALAGNQPNVWQGVSAEPTTQESTKNNAFVVNGKFTGSADTEFQVLVEELTSGVVSEMVWNPPSVITGLTNGNYTDLATTNVAATGSGLKLNLHVHNTVYNGLTQSGAQTTHNAVTTGAGKGGSGYLPNQTVKVAGNLFGGTTPAKDVTLTIQSVVNANLKFRVKKIVDGVDQGFGDLITAVAGADNAVDIGDGLSAAFINFNFFKKGEKILWFCRQNTTVSSDLYCLNTKDGTHLLKYWNGTLEVQHNVDSLPILDPENLPESLETDNRVGAIAPSSTSGVDFAQMNSKSVSIGLGSFKHTKPKWAGLQQYKQWNKVFKKETVIIEDAELKIPTEVPMFDDLVAIDTSNWYDASSKKGGPSGAWEDKFYVGFTLGSPELYLFRVQNTVPNFGSGNLHKALSYVRYSSQETNLTSPLAIASDGPHLYVLDDVASGYIHCFKWVGINDGSNSKTPNIGEMTKYNDNWPYQLPDTPQGIASKRYTKEVECAGAYYSDIMVTPTDSRFNTSTGGQGKIWIQASWEFDYKYDYAKYLDPDFEGSNSIDSDIWYPSIVGHTDDMAWLWSVDLANPAHPTGISPQRNSNGRLLMENRSPAMDKFYKVCGGFMTFVENNIHYSYLGKASIRGDYDITEGNHPQMATPTAGDDGHANKNTKNYWELQQNIRDWIVSQMQMGEKIGAKEAGVMQLFRQGLTDVGTATKVGVSCVYSGSDESYVAGQVTQTYQSYGLEQKRNIHTHQSSVIWAEMASSSAFYIDDFFTFAGVGDTSLAPIHIFPRSQFTLDASGNRKLIELAGIPACQMPTFNIVDGNAEGFSAKPLIMPLSEDILTNGYNAEELTQNDYQRFGKDNYSTTLTGNGGERGLLNENNLPSNLSRVNYAVDPDSPNDVKLVAYFRDGTIKSYNIEDIYNANSLHTGTGGGAGWAKSEFLRKNPFHHSNDAYVSTKAASEYIPGQAYLNADSNKGFVQHPRAEGMHLSGDVDRPVAYRDRNTYAGGVERYTDLHSITNFTTYSNRLGWLKGHIRTFTLPFEKSANTEAKINHDPEEPKTKWDFLPTQAMASGLRNLVLNQRKSQWSWVTIDNLDAGIVEPGTLKGFKSEQTGLTVTGHDNVGNGTPADGNARIGSPVAPGTSSFQGFWTKEEPADGTGSNTLPENKSTDYMYYAYSLVYDGHQESPLSESYGSSVDTNSGWSVQVDGDCLQVTITVPNIQAISRRVSHINVYRSKNSQDEPYAKAFFQLFKQVSLEDNKWIQDATYPDKYTLTVLDEGKTGETYETRTGVSELLDNTMVHYEISCQGEGYFFVSRAWHESAKENTNYIFRSKPGKFSVFDWSTDYVELPEYPTALSYYNGKLFAFSKSTTFIINPRNLVIEETILQCGAESKHSVVSSDYGLFWADSESIWLYQGSKITNVGLPIEQGGTSSYRQRDRTQQVSVEFDSLTKCFCLFLKPKSEVNNITGDDSTVNETQFYETSYKAAVWAYHIEKRRWDYWILNTPIPDPQAGVPLGARTYATARDWKGGVLYTNKDGMFRLGARKVRKAWQWISKNFVMGFPTLDKRFYKIRAVSQNGTPILQYKVNDAPLGLGLGANEKIATKKGKRIKVSVRAGKETAVDSIGIIYRKPKAK